jgi:phosphoadenosine phosphosulfate reductase
MLFMKQASAVLENESKPSGWHLEHLSDRFEAASPREILRWALETYGERLTMATAFGAEGCALIALLAGLRDETGLTPDIFNLETGYQFPQTLALKNRIEKKYDLPIRFVSNSESVAEMEARFGGPIYGSDPNECCHLRKVLPLRNALSGFDAYITAVRRDQTPERAGIPIIGFDPRHNIVKISPLANWTKDQVWDFIEENDVPTNPLHAQGFASIGCWPCTRAVEHGEDERAGRWADSDKRECGLHLHSHDTTPGRSTPGTGLTAQTAAIEI